MSAQASQTEKPSKPLSTIAELTGPLLRTLKRLVHSASKPPFSFSPSSFIYLHSEEDRQRDGFLRAFTSPGLALVSKMRT